MRLRVTWPTVLLLPLLAIAQPADAQEAAEGTATEPTAIHEEAPPSETTDAALDRQLAELRAEVDGLKAKAEEAELAALMAEAPAEAAAEEELPLRVYGFSDFGFDKLFLNPNSYDDDGIALLRPTQAGTFVFGNLNLYFDANPMEHLRTLIELRFATAPHGEEISLGPPLGTSYERTDTLAFDFSAPSAQTQLRLGSVFIERAWTQYEFSNLFKLQWGLFLNPFGIWNIDHGSPTLISLMLPTFVAGQMIPTRLLGINLYGSTFSGNTEIGYAVHITNGRSPIDYDMTEDKALGGRFYVAHEGDFGRLVLGTSGYIGSYSDMQKVLDLAHPGKNLFDWVANVAYKEQILGVDAALDVGSLRLRSEAVFRWIEYDNGKHDAYHDFSGNTFYLPSRMEYSAYVLAAYRTPWRLEPYFETEVSSKSFMLPRWAGTSRATSSDVVAISPSVGLNIEISPNLLLKTQVAWANGYHADFTHHSLSTFMWFSRVVTTF